MSTCTSTTRRTSSAWSSLAGTSRRTFELVEIGKLRARRLTPELLYDRSTGVLWHALKNRRMFLAASQAIRFRHAISPFHAYEIKTQMVYWDGPWIYFLHQFQDPTSGKQFAEGLCRVMVKQGKEGVSFEKMISEVYDGQIPPQPAEVPDVVKGFLEWDSASRSSMEAAHELENAKISSNPPPPKPAKLGARIWMEMQRAMNRP